MLIIPAIDIKNGKCVRLTQGDYTREKIYNEDPVMQALQWEDRGAKMLHIVDLDGAKNGFLDNFEIIKRINQVVKIPLQVGGGIRSKKTVKRLLYCGVSRVVLGTVALENEKEMINILSEFASQIAVALDTKDGKLMKQGWLEDSDRNLIATAVRLQDLGVQRFIYTDVIKDGTMTEPNYKEIANLTKNLSVPVIASGGISDINNIIKLNSLKVEGIIIGKALYENKFNLREAMHAY
ncbi:MAG TPA: 1-(5-phosphoribosyl)-5-[(5-phosphoribosylamino)methylideneamino]imidazole-4-carboxamide isomerase [Candidatus Limnocylindrales bacterium]|nr:1-(5-phosphoribosyl)-5-[(5-phosphoribosylamino)methylideneamino]imidazole-4-carboxamide isomerase [Candidatus Limnocylindrales bacterium]